MSETPIVKTNTFLVISATTSYAGDPTNELFTVYWVGQGEGWTRDVTKARQFGQFGSADYAKSLIEKNPEWLKWQAHVVKVNLYISFEEI